MRRSKYAFSQFANLAEQQFLHLQGLDPASRRNLWDVVKAAKPGRGIILTTHSMEEAEVSIL